jgi:hypothetical protein
MTRPTQTRHASTASSRRRRRPQSRPRIETLEARRLLSLTVDTLDDVVADDGLTSLREAIAAAAANPGDDAITFAPGLSGTIALAPGELVLDDSSGAVSITAVPGAITLDAGGSNRVMSVVAGTTAFITGLTFTGGHTIRDCGCFGVDDGGGIENLGTLTLERVTVRDNVAEGAGGGIANRGTLTLVDSTVSGNTSASVNLPPYGINGTAGGGIFSRGTLRVIGSTISGNTSERGPGGGIESGYRATTQIVNSTITGNTASGSGGGIRNYAGTLSVVNSTITLNRAGNSGAGLNSQSYYGVTTTLHNTIVAGNRRLDDTPDDLSGTNPTADSIGNVVGTGGGLDPTFNLAGVDDPRLAPLADNGGPTWTHLPLEDSPAVGFGFSSAAVDPDGMPLATDQRGTGFARVVGVAVDAGAVELDPEPPRPVPESGSLVVTTLDDVIDRFDSVTSLREAIGFANSDSTDDPVTFALALAGGTIHLTSELFVGGSFRVEAPTGGITLDAGGASRVMTVGYGSDLTFTRVTFTGGATQGPASWIPASNGGGILLQGGTLTLVESTISGNTAVRGGGIATRYGTLNLVDSTVSGNTAPGGVAYGYLFGGYGGGITTYGGRVTLTRSTIAGNTAARFGGGIDLYYGTRLTVTESVISGNSAGGNGGGINKRDGTPLSITDSTITGNTSAADGGGLFIAYGPTTISGSTLAGNSAAGDGGGLANFSRQAVLTNTTLSGNSAGGSGGGIMNGGIANLTNVTATRNTADADGSGDGDGGGLFARGNSYFTPTSRLVNSIVAGNRRGPAGTPDDLAGVAPAPGSIRNIVGAGVDGLDPAQNLLGVDPLLGPLADNGGPTLTHALLDGSPALDAALYLASVAVDQRGVPRPQDGTSDIGAFERVGSPPPTPEPGGLVVTTRDDLADPYDGLTSLREALAYAATLPGDDVIAFAPGLTGTFALQTTIYGPLTIDDATGSVTLDGGGLITLDGQGQDRILLVAAGSTAFLAGLTLTGGVARDFDGGGAILNRGDLTITDSRITGNSASTGGGVMNRQGRLTIIRGTIADNSAGAGGAIAAAGSWFGGPDDGLVTLIDSTVSGNSASGSGGAISSSYAPIVLVNTTLSGNSARDRGAAIYATGIASGGALVAPARITLTHSTITANRAEGAQGPDQVGGAIAFRQFGGLTMLGEAGFLHMDNSIVAGNRRGAAGSSADAPDDVADRGAEVSGAGNVIGTGGGQLDPLRNFLGVIDPRLAPLADNGGPTRTHLPMPGSPALDTGFADLAVAPDGSSLTTDQRGPGFARVVGVTVDAGAVESALVSPPRVPESPALVVTTLDDVADRFDGRTSLREALAYAAIRPGDDVVTFAGGLSGTVALLGTLHIDDASGAVTVDGGGLVTLDAGRQSRVAWVHPGARATLAGLTITGGTAGEGYAFGGGIINVFADLTLVGCVVQDNVADSGAGILNYAGFYGTEGDASLTLIDSVVRANRARYAGGGIMNSGGVLSLTRVSVLDNRADATGSFGGGYGGGIISYAGSLSILASTIRGNAAITDGDFGGVGGGLVTNATTAEIVDSTIADNLAQAAPWAGQYGGRAGGISSGGNLSIRGSTISGNRALRGAGIDNSGTLSLVNSTVSGNAAAGDGGGLYNSGTLTLTHATVTNNRADSDGDGMGTGGGVFTRPGTWWYGWYQAGGTTAIQNTIVAGNRSGAGSAVSDDLAGADPTPDSAGNVVGTGGAALNRRANRTGVTDPRLGPLADNGGPTLTHRPLPGSRAINAGFPLDAVPTDQRGVARPRNGRVDAGAVEVRPSDLVGFRVQPGQRQRSFIRTIELSFYDAAGALEMTGPGRLRLVRYRPDGSGPGRVVRLDGLIRAEGKSVVIDFGPKGLGGNPAGRAADGYYVLELDLDGDGTFETARRFHRLLGDVNGDGSVSQADLLAIAAAFLRVPGQSRDVDGNGSVDLGDYRLAASNLGAAIDPALRRDA